MHRSALEWTLARSLACARIAAGEPSVRCPIERVQEHHCALLALEQVGAVALDIDAQLQVLAVTGQARRWLQQSGTWSMQGDRLRCQHARLGKLLGACVDAALETPGKQGAVQWQEGDASRIAIVAPALPGRAASARMFVLADPFEFDGPRLEALWMSVWQLTQREAQIARLLALGADSERVCAELGIGANTLKFHLRSIFAKTGTKRRSELVVQLGRLRFSIR